MAKHKNEEHFNIGGDKTVEVTIVFDVADKAGEMVALRNARYYLDYLINGLEDGENRHTAWGRSIEVKTISK